MWAESFYKPQGVDVMKGVLEFNLPDEGDEYYNATNGTSYRVSLSLLVDELEKSIRESIGTDKAKYYSEVVTLVNNIVRDLDVKLFRK